MANFICYQQQHTFRTCNKYQLDEFRKLCFYRYFLK